jgi:hypothetical protein
MSYVVIGTDYPLSDSGLRQALSDGHRYLVLSDSIVLLSPLNLSDYGPPYVLRLEGGGGRTTHLLRGFGSGNLLTQNASGSDIWKLSVSGIIFQGRRSNYPGLLHNVALYRVQDSFFEDCIFEDASGHSFLVSGATSRNLSFVSCHFNANTGHGLSLQGCSNVTIVGGSCTGNGGGGLWLGSAPMSGPHNVQGMFFRNNDPATNRGATVRDARCAAIRNCYFDVNNLVFESSTELCIAENNMLGSGAQLLKSGTRNVYPDNINA